MKSENYDFFFFLNDEKLITLLSKDKFITL